MLESSRFSKSNRILKLFLDFLNLIRSKTCLMRSFLDLENDEGTEF